MTDDGLRIDKWLWATRVFKTRPLATQACQRERIKINERNVKPSRLIRPGDVIEIRRPDILKTIRVKAVVAKRISPKQVVDYIEDLTPPAEYERQKEFLKTSTARRERGSGRPTKKERRDTDRFFEI